MRHQLGLHARKPLSSTICDAPVALAHAVPLGVGTLAALATITHRLAALADLARALPTNPAAAIEQRLAQLAAG